ncbi:MAG: TonB-dependent receptor [Tannerella sp.]|jgi:TonB-linked SusC/RagA family outer membrane protein|nr:TonB-dependent receptor [Tannerella sp.]
MKKYFVNGIINAKPERMKRMLLLSAFILAIGTGMMHAATTYPSPETVEPQQSRTRVTGTVVDQNDEPVIGANVMEKGVAANGTITDTEGKFALEVRANATLQISYIGYVTQEISVAGQSNLTVRLAEDNLSLEEVVVVGYGTQKKGVLTGSVATTRGAEIIKSPAANLGQSLEGRLPGVVINNRGGRPGDDGVSINIRGKSTTGNNNPLILIDGIAGRGSLERLNPNDIESITVLKDATAAIYGSRSANGVILVTTKRGKTGKPVIDFNVNWGLQEPTRLPKMADAVTFAEYYSEIDVYDGRQPTYSAADIEKYRNGSDPIHFPNTDWAEESLRKTAPQQRYNISVSGGAESVRYFVSGGYSDQDGLFKNGATHYQQYDIRSNVDASIAKYLNVGIDLSGRLEDRNYSGHGDDFWRMYRGYPNILARWPNGLPTGGMDSGNPVITSTEATGYQKRNYSVFNGMFTANWDMSWLLDGLAVGGYAAYDRMGNNQKNWTTPWTYYTWDEATDTYEERTSSLVQTATLRHEYTPETSLTVNTRLTYKHNFADVHNVDIMAGYEQNSYRRDNFWTSRRDFLSTSIDQLFAGSSNKSNFDNSGTASETARRSYFGRAVYDYAGKYMIQATFRYDGSYIFQKDKRWGFFPGISAGWRLSEESFLKDRADWLDNLKLRASWGKQGNDNITAFQYMLKYTYGRNYVFNATDAQGVYQVGFPNQDVTWEVADTYNAALEGSVLNGLLGFEAEIFKMTRSNILAKRNASIPNYTGLINLPDENIGKVNNRGFELQLTHRNKGGEVQYSLAGNFLYARNKVVFIDETPWPEGHDYMKAEGKPLGAGLYYKTAGIFRNQQEIDAYPHLAGTIPGDLKYEDMDGDGAITNLDRERRDLTNFPEIVFGLTATASWKNFDFSILLQGQGRAEQAIHFRVDQSSNSFMERLEDRWSPTNLNGSMPRAGGNNNNYDNYNSDFWIQNASFLRLKNMEIGYTLPSELYRKLYIKNLRLYLSGYNLFTISRIKLLDPETSSVDGSYYPQLRIFNAGINLTF